MNRVSLCIGALLLSVLSSVVGAQGLIIDRRPEMPVNGFYTVESVAIDSTIRDQVAEVQVSQTFRNPQRRQIEAEFLFPLPEDGAVQSFTLLVDGKEMPGKLLTATEARRIYDEIVRSKKDPALLEYMDRGVLKTSVFPIPAGQTRTVTLRYTQLCKRDGRMVRFAYPLSTHKHADKNIGKLSIALRLVSAESIKSIYSPSHAIDIKRTSANEAHVHYTEHDGRPGDDFRLMYDLASEQVGATVLSYRPNHKEDGYFLMLASPGFASGREKPMAKTIICVLDKSGSMRGKKIEQAQNALEFVLRNLNEDDTFNVLTYNDSVDYFKPELQRYSRKTRDAALEYVEGIRAGGSTNIDQALTTAMQMIHDGSRPTYVLFLSDGVPTAGEQNEMDIARNCKRKNKYQSRLISFGVGHDVNARLLDRLTHENGGVSEYVTPDEDIEAAVARFYGRITTPVMSNIEVLFGGARINRMYPDNAGDLFAGQQCVIVGRYTTPGRVRVHIDGTVGREKERFTYRTTLADAGNGSAYAFVEKLWVQRRIGHIIDRIDLHGKNQELIAELVELSKKHGILTPYTAFLADEETELTATARNTEIASAQTEQLQQVTGRAGVGQRAAKQNYKLSPQISSQPIQPEGINVSADPKGFKKAMDRSANVRNIADRSFFRKSSQWIQSDLSEARQNQAIEIKQFSKEYYDLIDRIGNERQYLVFKEDVMLELEGKVYNVRR